MNGTPTEKEHLSGEHVGNPPCKGVSMSKAMDRRSFRVKQM